MNSNWINYSLLGAFSFILMISFLFVAEYLLKTINKDSVSNIENQRYIRLKEHKPESSTIVIPDKHYLKDTDSLEVKEYLLRVDKNGFIEPNNKDDNITKSIYFLGGSTTECLYVDEDKRFPILVEKNIENKLSMKLNTYNSGVSGNNSFHSIDIILHKIIPLNPDYIVLMHNINDIHMYIDNKDGYWGNVEGKSLIIKEKDKLVLGEIVKKLFPEIRKVIRNAYYKYFPKKLDELASMRGKKIHLDKAKILNAFKNNLELFIALSKIYDFKPVLMTQFNRFTKEPDSLIKKIVSKSLEESFGIKYNNYYDLYSKMNEIIRIVSKKHKIKLIDLDILVPKESEYIYDSVHLNTKGSIYVSEIISRELIADNFLK